MPTGAPPLLPISTTKVGAGDKERAYVIRQNCVLKLLLGIVVMVVALGGALCTTRYEVHVQRRNSLHHAREHREEEHTSHMHIMRLSILLQQRLKDEMKDMNVLTQYRSVLLKTVGDYQNNVAKLLEHNCTNAGPELRKAGVEFDEELERVMKDLWDDLVSEGKAAKKQLHNITNAILGELRQDSHTQYSVVLISSSILILPRFRHDLRRILNMSLRVYMI